MTRAGVLAAALAAAVVASAAPAGAAVVTGGAPHRPADVAPAGRTAADVVVGTGTPVSCTSRAVVRAVAEGGVTAR